MPKKNNPSKIKKDCKLIDDAEKDASQELMAKHKLINPDNLISEIEKNGGCFIETHAKMVRSKLDDPDTLASEAKSHLSKRITLVYLGYKFGYGIPNEGSIKNKIAQSSGNTDYDTEYKKAYDKYLDNLS